jgi:excisionase family DNA binding protein
MRAHRHSPATVPIREWAAMAGLPVETVRRLVRAGEIRALRPGRAYAIPVAELDRWVRSGDAGTAVAPGPPRTRNAGTTG